MNKESGEEESFVAPWHQENQDWENNKHKIAHSKTVLYNYRKNNKVTDQLLQRDIKITINLSHTDTIIIFVYIVLSDAEW